MGDMTEVADEVSVEWGVNVTGYHVHLEARGAGGGFGSDVDPILVRKKS